MHIQVTASITNNNNAILYPIIKNKKLSAVLKSIAKETGLSEKILNEDFSANSKEILSFYAKGNAKVYLLGLGENSDSNKIIQCARSFFHHRKNKLPAILNVDFVRSKSTDFALSILTGLALGNYDINFYKTNKTAKLKCKTIQAVFKEKDIKKAEKLAVRAAETAKTIKSIMDLVNKPANKKRPQEMAEWAVQSGKENRYSVRVMDKAEIEKEGLHALLAVNRGSEDPAKFIVCEYLPKTRKAVRKVGLVGKGVTFDTGGVSIKGSTNMHLMKSDMGGSAAVFGAIELVAKLQLSVHLIAVVGATDNSVDALSYKPSDVIESYAGKTIEVIDTDAEGRLTLADGLAYVNRNFKPDVLIDIATLTGAVIRALGYAAAGLYTQNDDLAEKLLTAGKQTGEKLWRMPMWDDYKGMIKSDVADVRNYSGKPIAGSITAAKFLEHFVEEHPAWAHLDIAGTSVTANEFATDRSATGYGVRLLLQFIENFASLK